MRTLNRSFASWDVARSVSIDRASASDLAALWIC